jgi:phosphoribosylformylglycinamidine synthase
MWAAKLPGEGPKMYDTCEALSQAVVALGASIDGGKDSLSMAASVGVELVKSPGMITGLILSNLEMCPLTCLNVLNAVTAYVTVSDVTKTVTPDLKYPGVGRLLHVDLSGSKKYVFECGVYASSA